MSSTASTSTEKYSHKLNKTGNVRRRRLRGASGTQHLDFSLMYVALNEVEGVCHILLLFTAVQVEPYVIYLECYYFQQDLLLHFLEEFTICISRLTFQIYPSYIKSYVLPLEQQFVGVEQKSILTYLLYRAESYLRSYPFHSQSRNSPHFMETEVSLPHLQVPATCSYPEPDQSSPCPSSHFLKVHLNIILPSTISLVLPDFNETFILQKDFQKLLKHRMP